jgi:LysR family glycine cleavage system transcriptional activator
MPVTLPPLNALRAFEAAGRHLSFKSAADELSVTPAALSLQIKNLEAHLGAPLFRRLNRAVELTDAGRTLLPFMTDGFDTLARGWRTTQTSLDDSSLTITAGPAFTAKWLAPRMFRFAQTNPEIELRFSASLKLVDFERDTVDLAIRFGRGDDEGLFREDLIDEWLTPMMHPRLAKDLMHPRDLASVPLIHDDSISFLEPKPDWSAWFKLAGLEGPSDHGPRFSNSDHAIDAALEGNGVVDCTVQTCGVVGRVLQVGLSVGIRRQTRHRQIPRMGKRGDDPLTRSDSQNGTDPSGQLRETLTLFVECLVLAQHHDDEKRHCGTNGRPNDRDNHTKFQK